VLELLETGGEPGPIARAPDEQYRTRAAVRGRRQDAVDPEVAVRLEGDTHRIRVALHKGSRDFTNQRGEDAGVGFRPDGVAPREQQAAPIDSDASIRFHLRAKIRDDPDLSRRVDAADYVSG